MASQSPFTRSPSLARSRPTLTRGQVPRYAASSAVASDFQNETGPKGLCLSQMTKNPPRFFRAAAKLQRGQSSPERTHFSHAPVFRKNTHRINVPVTVPARFAAAGFLSVLAHLTFFSTRLLNQSPSLSPSPLRKNEPPSSGLRPSQVSQSLR